jgi:hypothetical protein
MQSNEWAENFRLAYEAYSLAQNENELRESAALTFLQWISKFKDRGFSAIERLQQELLGRDFLRRNVAAYILIEVAERARLDELTETLATIDNNTTTLSHQVLKRLWAASPPKNGRELFWKWHHNNIHAHIPLLEALLAKPTTQAYDFAKEILSSGDSRLTSRTSNYYGRIALRHIADWGQTDWLQEVFEHIPVDPTSENQSSNFDLQLEAAFYLGLVGNQQAVSFLELMASRDDAHQAAEATIKLSLLAQPSVIEKIKPLLAAEDGNVVVLALSAATHISTVDLIPELINLANREVYCDFYSEPLCDDALRTIRAIVGHNDTDTPQERFFEGTYGTFGGAYTHDYRAEAIRYYTERIKHFERGLRYQTGELLTLKQLATNLLSRHSGPFENAVFNLTAITGQRYDIDLDPHYDFIANVKAIRLWNDYAAHSNVLKPGGWAYQGRPLDYPYR